MKIRNWRDAVPSVVHKAGVDWNIMVRHDRRPKGDPGGVMHTLKFVSRAQSQPGLSYEPHLHSDHEELYYIIKGQGKMRIGQETASIRDGDLIYIPPRGEHSITNDGDETIEFLVFGADVQN